MSKLLENIGLGERFKMAVARSLGLKDGVALHGITLVKKNGIVLLEKHNTINVALKSYVQDSLDSATDNAINDLFAADENGGTVSGKDGILAKDSGGTNYTMLTTAISATQTYGKRWKGVLDASASYNINGALLGYNCDTGVNPYIFNTGYASQSFSAVPLTSSDTLTIEWEIYVS